MQPWNWNRFLYTNFTSAGRTYVRKLKILHDFTRKVIQDRRAARAAAGSAKARAPAAEGESQKKPFLDMLLDATDDDGQPLTDAGPCGPTTTHGECVCVGTLTLV